MVLFFTLQGSRGILKVHYNTIESGENMVLV